jgi:N-dimethylarginine dimethylaminohydrolase
MRLLMCPPIYYGIEYEINPWMSRSRQSNRQIAQDQWNGLYRVLENEMGADIDLIRPRSGLPDMVFTANGGLVWENKLIVSQFRHEARRGEASHFENWFRDHGCEIIHLPAGSYFEGEGDLLRCGEFFFAGYHIRSDIFAHQRVAEIIQNEVLSLELTNEWFYHLDTCFCPLGEGKALFYPPAFDAYALKVLEKHIPDLIPVHEEEARLFACNSIVAGRKIALNAGCRRTREKLEAMNFAVYENPLSEFIKAGGSAKCLVLKIPMTS